MSAEYDAAVEICGPLESIRQELDYIGKKLDNTNLADRRERIATSAMIGLLSCVEADTKRKGTKTHQETHQDFVNLVAKTAVSYADALILALDSVKNPVAAPTDPE